MSNTSKVNYLKGSARKKLFKLDGGGFDEVIYLSILSEQVSEMANERGYTSIEVRKRDDVDDYGNTHYLVLRTPEEEQARIAAYKARKEASGTVSAKAATPDVEMDEPPF